MKRPIVIEGPDGCGKSFLVRRLVEFYPGLRPYHSGGPPDSQMGLMLRMLRIQRVIDETPSAIVLDRVPMISELVYGPVMRDELRMPRKESLLYLAALHPVVVYCKIPPQDATHYMVKEAKEHKTQAYTEAVGRRASRIHQAYHEIMLELAGDYGVSVFHYDWRVSGEWQRLINHFYLNGAL